jgi:hypothetical protein
MTKRKAWLLRPKGKAQGCFLTSGQGSPDGELIELTPDKLGMELF